MFRNILKITRLKRESPNLIDDSGSLFSVRGRSDAALRQHGVRHFHETADVGSYDVVDIAVGLGAVFDAHGVDVAHDGMQPGIDLLGRP